MAATREDVNRWIESARKDGYKFIISVCDTFSYEYYPVYCKDEVELAEKHKKYENGANMQRINEVIEVKFNNVDLEITPYGEFIFNKNDENGNYSIVKLPFNKEDIQSVVDVVDFFNRALPEGFTVTLLNEDNNTFTMVTPAGEDDFKVEFYKKGIQFTRLYDNALVTHEHYSQERKVISLLKNFYQFFWEKELFAKRVKDNLGLDADEIREISQNWETKTKRYVTDDNYVIDVDKDFKGKVIGKKIYNDYGYGSEIITLSSIEADIKALEKKRQELLDIEKKFNFK